MLIHLDDLAGPEIRSLLEEHLCSMHELSPLGCGALKKLAPSHGEIKSMRTAIAHRGKGVGRTMLEHILAEAHKRCYACLSLETGSMAAFVPARRLYESFWFSYCAPFADYTDDPNSVFMTRTVD